VKLELKEYRIRNVIKTEIVISIVKAMAVPKKAKPADRQLAFQSLSVFVTTKEEFNRT
jgi:hypothetical protein